MLSDRELYAYKASLSKVKDGDTIVLDINLGFSLSQETEIRLYGVDTPEVYSVKKDSEEYSFGAKAKSRVVALLTHNPLYVFTIKDRTGKYGGTYLGEIWFETYYEGKEGWHNLSEVLLQEGLAVEYHGKKKKSWPERKAIQEANRLAWEQRADKDE